MQSISLANMYSFTAFLGLGPNYSGTYFILQRLVLEAVWHTDWA